MTSLPLLTSISGKHTTTVAPRSRWKHPRLRLCVLRKPPSLFLHWVVVVVVWCLLLSVLLTKSDAKLFVIPPQIGEAVPRRRSRLSCLAQKLPVRAPGSPVRCTANLQPETTKVDGARSCISNGGTFVALWEIALVSSVCRHACVIIATSQFLLNSGNRGLCLFAKMVPPAPPVPGVRVDVVCRHTRKMDRTLWT